MPTLHVNKTPSRTDLTVFGLCLPAAGALLGWSFWHHHHTTAAPIIWATAALLTLAYWAVPPLRRPMFLALSYATAPLGLAVSLIVLTLVFYLVITPAGLIMRMAGYDPMALHLDPTAKTYWLPRKPPQNITDYFRQF